MLGLWIAALASDRFYNLIGLPRHIAFREQPLAFAHDAAIFAGQSGLPDRALIYGLDQTGVYDFHNAPRCMPFMDGRLEMPDLATFKTYVAIEDWLAEQDPRWQKAVAELGNPLLLLSHEGYSGGPQAALLAHPDWRCVYFDALAAVFVPRERVSANDFPSVDFAARHFQEPGRPSVPNVRRAAAREVKALYNLAAALPAESIRRWRPSLLLAALDGADFALKEDERQPDVWILLGNCHRDLHLDTTAVPFSPLESWQVERDLRWAQATYCFQRALKLQPDNGTAWRYLAMSYAQRGLIEAELAASEQWVRFDPKVSPRQS
jgi:tetratricopeptide (TPR) repeat protein